MPRPRKRSVGRNPDHITKARLVEEIVALLHEAEGVTVERNARLPSLSDSTQIREIDVLVTGNVAGYPVRIPIECKNYADRITAAQIGEFRDKLEDVGLPVRNSIYVCVSGFGRDARRRAEDHGIKIFELRGLTPDRLSSAVHKAFQSTVYLLLRVEYVEFKKHEDEDLWVLYWLKDRRGNYRGGIWDIIWEKWQAGEIPTDWGFQEIHITPPKGWSWHLDDPTEPRKVMALVKVIGLILTATGEAHMHELADILEQRLDRGHIRAYFENNPEAITLAVVDDEEQFLAATRPQGVANIVFASEKAPRIHVLSKLYWPPTEKAASVIKERMNALMATDNPDWDSLKELTFEDLEGIDIGAIWGKGWDGHPSSRGEDWPMAFPPGSRPARSAPRRINPKKRRRR
jgi:Restriction endonuclease